MDQYIGRIVVLITPLFAGLAGAIVTLVGEHFPGAPSLDSTELTALFVAGAGAAAAAVYKWLDNRGKYERETLGGMSIPVSKPSQGQRGAIDLMTVLIVLAIILAVILIIAYADVNVKGG